jgi:hypothetical protein
LHGGIYRLKFSPTLPHAFTEHGAMMLASVLNSQRAIEASIDVVRVFVKLREMLITHKDLARKLAELEQRVASHDGHIQNLFEAIRQLTAPPKTGPKRIGFYVKERAPRYGHRRLVGEA